MTDKISKLQRFSLSFISWNYLPVESARAPHSGDTTNVAAGVIALRIPICESVMHS